MYLKKISFMSIVLAIFIILYSKRGHKYPAFTDVVYGWVTIYSLFIVMNIIFFFKRIDAKIGVFLIVFIFYLPSISSHKSVRIISWSISIVFWLIIGLLNMLSIYEPFWCGKLGCF